MFNDKILAHRRNYIQTDEVVLGVLPKAGCERDIVWKTVCEAIPIKELQNCTYHYMDISHDNDDSVSKLS